ncbi:MAG: DNA mismatch repair protein MutS, partial [Verrucomicrobiota bacterium]|nr:DNA mismatch repair protein MutS [Verrucomicrobiota bacterium]
MPKEAKLTPMMAQYRQCKGQLPAGTILLFRLGDFYEMFFEDAQEAAGILNVALTKRGDTPMCGIPYHATGNYLSKLLTAGRKVAICDQVETAKPGQLVKREVTQILSPGAHFDERMLEAGRNNFLVAVSVSGGRFGLAAIDLTTGDFKAAELENEIAMLAELERLNPGEVIFPEESQRLAESVGPSVSVLNGYDGWVFALETAEFTLKDHFKVAALDGFGLKGRTAAVGAAGGALHYVSQHLRRDVAHFTRLTFYEVADYLVLDAATLKHLEILEPLHREAAKPGTLYAALNRTSTPMGARRLRDWLSQPLSSVEAIRRRQGGLVQFLNNSPALNRFHDGLKEVRDLERTISRLSIGSGNARDLGQLRSALGQLPALRSLIAEVQDAPSADAPTLSEAIFDEPETDGPPPLLSELGGQLHELPEVTELISRAIADEPPLTIKDGGIIRDGFDPALDELRQAATEGKDWIAQLQQEESEKTSIPSLKVRFNSVFGYFIEVTKTHLDKVPGHYTRKQTMTNAERFITPELKEMEGKILGAEERSQKLEHELFQRVREEVLQSLPRIQQIASALAQLDVLASFAEVARLRGYVCPEVRDDGVLQIDDGRHPVLEQAIVGEPFVPNDTQLESDDRQIAVITGPNMAGKSTYIRQVALLTLMAHTGSFVPAKGARVDLVDRIFTRIGASDDLSRGQSTFMVEMTETANILNNATDRSLVVLDEVGRGTSTFDGLSLAWSIVEHLHNQVGAKTFFATHYHELTELAGRLPRLCNFNVAVREWNDQIVFLHKIVEGGADKSYGIHVARLAGVPRPVIERAKAILRNLEETELS